MSMNKCFDIFNCEQQTRSQVRKNSHDKSLDQFRRVWRVLMTVVSITVPGQSTRREHSSILIMECIVTTLSRVVTIYQNTSVLFACIGDINA